MGDTFRLIYTRNSIVVESWGRVERVAVNLLLCLRHRMQHIQNEKGATLIEYALLLSLIAVAVTPAMMTLTDPLNLNFEEIAKAIGGSEGTDILSEGDTGTSSGTDPVIILRVESTE